MYLGIRVRQSVYLWRTFRQQPEFSYNSVCIDGVRLKDFGFVKSSVIVLWFQIHFKAEFWFQILLCMMIWILLANHIIEDCRHCPHHCTGHISKRDRWIVHDKSCWSILFEVKRSNVEVGVRLHFSECQSSSLFTKNIAAYTGIRINVLLHARPSFPLHTADIYNCTTFAVL